MGGGVDLHDVFIQSHGRDSPILHSELAGSPVLAPDYSASNVGKQKNKKDNKTEAYARGWARLRWSG